MQSAQLLFVVVVAVAYCGDWANAADVLNKAAVETKNVLAASKASGQTIRECSCPEEEQCIGQMQGQIRDCFHTCWAQDRQIQGLSQNPEQLKQCFASREHLINDFIQCVKAGGETCVQTKAGPQVPYVDLDRLMGVGEQRLRAQAQQFMRSMGGQSQKLVKAAMDVGACMKQCFSRENARGTCFDRTECHPKLEEELAEPVIKRCAHQIGWKKEAGQICECALRAGVMSVKPYCQILHGAEKSRSDNIPLQRH